MRLVIFFICLSGINLFSFAQSSPLPAAPGKWNIYAKLGIQGGGPLYKSESIVSKKGSAGFCPLGGFGASYTFFQRKNSLSLSFETFYSRRKINYSSDVKDQYYIDQQTLYIGGNPYEYEVETTFTGDTEGSFDMHYLELPLMVQYGVGEKWTIQAGGYYSWMFNGSNKGEATGIVGRTDVPDPSTIEDKSYDNSAHLNTRYWGMTAGSQYEVSSKVKVDLRMTYSFRSLYDEDWAGVDYTLKDLYLQLSAQYIFFKSKV